MSGLSYAAEHIAAASRWGSIPLGDIVDILDSRRKPITKRNRKSGPYPYYGATGVVDWVDDYLFDEELVLVGEDGAKWGAGDESAFAISGKSWVNNHAHVLRPNRKQVEDTWLIYFLNVADLSTFISGLTVPKLNQGRLREIPVPLPPLEEQKQLVKKLGQAFAALDRARVHAEANLTDALSLYSRVVDSELSDDKLGRLEGLDSHIDLLTGFAFKSKGYTDDPGDIRLIRGDNIVQGEFRWAGVKRWPSSEKSIYSKYELALGDVLVAMDRTWVSAGIKYAIVDEKALPSLLVQRVARLRTKSTLLPRYLGYWIGSHAFEKYVLSIQKGLGVPHVSGSQLEGFNIRVPSIEEQRAVIERLDALSEHHSMLVAAYERQLAEVAALRQSLLQQAFSGQLT